MYSLIQTSVELEAVTFSVPSSVESLSVSMNTNRNYPVTVGSGKVIYHDKSSSYQEEMDIAVTSESLSVSMNTNRNYPVTVGSGKVIYHDVSYHQVTDIAVTSSL